MRQILNMNEMDENVSYLFDSNAKYEYENRTLVIKVGPFYNNNNDTIWFKYTGIIKEFKQNSIIFKVFQCEKKQVNNTSEWIRVFHHADNINIGIFNINSFKFA